ncbi:hypothetical protein SAMN06297144_0318 [Sphingomonas guangdongensis]|uniref:DUF2059 domain-containing protein n=1 Tax=Sphingomonas guangdongensis TaxID=1141890 RepID=A0A285QAM0_9SPHN|nr:DUF2059 domain-containing protein [Sphingomonas guangdongensis]SOB78995.1 hypothetical protein SAMN06297144_0318 [Sphingomonas guangdongensis]
MSLLLALLLAAQGAPAAPPRAPAAATLSEATASELLGIVLPLDRAVAEQRRAHREALAERFATDAALRARAAATPAFRPAVERAVDQEVDATYRRLAPALQGEVLGIYRQTLSEGEGRELVRWFRTPTGQKLVTAMARGTADSGATTARGVGDDARRAALATLGPEDLPALEQIAKRPELMAKMRGAAPAIAAASDRFVERCTAALATSLPAVIAAVGNSFGKDS